MSTSPVPALCRPHGQRPSAPSSRRPWRHSPPLGRGLSPERERELANRIQAGDQAARNELVEANLALCETIARSFAEPQCAAVDLDDMVQEARIGLMRAAELFDPAAHGTRFSTYASYWMNQGIRRLLNRQAFTVRIPEYLFCRGEAPQHVSQVIPLGWDHIDPEPQPIERLIAAEDEERLQGLIRDLSAAECLTLWSFLYPRLRPAGRYLPNQVDPTKFNHLIERLRARVQEQEGATIGDER